MRAEACDAVDNRRACEAFGPQPKRTRSWLVPSPVEHWWATPVQFLLLLFGLANAGVPFEQVGPGTYFVLAGLLLGKPIGILLLSRAPRLAGASLPAGLHLVDLVLIGSSQRSALPSLCSSRRRRSQRARL